MAHKWKTEGAPVPLFERLMDDQPDVLEEPISKKILNKKELRESILEELNRILNTRCTLKRDVYKEIGPMLTTFGIPELFGMFDTTRFDAANSLERPRMERMIQRSIEAFEPRLKDPRVTIVTFNKGTQSLSLTIEADMIMGDVLEPVSFPLDLAGFLKADPS